MSENDNFDDAGHLGNVYLYSYPGKINNNYSTPNISRAHEYRMITMLLEIFLNHRYES